MKKIIPVLSILILIALVGFGIYRYQENKKQEPMRPDFDRIATESYTAVFLSTYPIDYFTEEDFRYYRGIYPLNASYCIPDLAALKTYLRKVDETNNEVETVYLGIRPDLIPADKLMKLISERPDRRYEVVIAYPSLDYWKNLSDKEFTRIFSDYRNFITTAMSLSQSNEWIQQHVSFYFYGSTEWLVANPANYESDFGVNPGISHVLSMYTDSDHGYQLTGENCEARLNGFENLVTEYRSAQNNPALQYPDLSDWDVVFFGDSIMAFPETSSIPGAFSGKTGAHVYNCAVGGAPATAYLPQVVDRFLAQDLTDLSEDSVIYKGMSDYFEHAGAERKTCFVLDFGMNDFFTGAPVQNASNPYDINTYSGALRTATDKLTEAYPNAVILFVATNFTSYFNNGQEPQSEEGGTLPQYIAAMKQISEENSFLFYNSYTELPINSENYPDYLLDGCHPNESTRYLMACDIARLMR